MGDSLERALREWWSPNRAFVAIFASASPSSALNTLPLSPSLSLSLSLSLPLSLSLSLSLPLSLSPSVEEVTYLHGPALSPPLPASSVPGTSLERTVAIESMITGAFPCQSH